MKTPSYLAVVLLAACFSIGTAQQTAPHAAPAAQTHPAPRTWFVRLIPPRATFAEDMTPEERRLMGEHYAYWKDLYAKGVCLFGGPVLDPKGVYGVLALAADTEEKALAIASADPSVKAGINHIEIAEIQIAFPPHHKE